ncbi:MAG: ABC transporter permease [Rhodobacteraceae bacterium]|nr:ABC transporter permease [Paracoccaceae bacterium]
MARFLVSRLILSLLVALTVSVIGFSLMRLSGDLAMQLAGDQATTAEVERVAAQYGLDRPLVVQYFDWAGNMLRGDMGRSLFTNESVGKLIADRVGVTALLAAGSLLLAVGLGVPLGVVAAWRPNSLLDRAVLLVAVAGQAIPNFWFGLMAIFLFSVALGWLPVAGSQTAAHFVLPILTLGLSVLPQFARLTRSGVLETLESNYVRAARAKGISQTRILFRHALPNALLPIVSLAAVTLGFLLGGSVIVEAVFSLNGIGLLAYNAILVMDYPVVQAVVVFVSFVYILLTFMADILNARLDPRIRLG